MVWIIFLDNIYIDSDRNHIAAVKINFTWVFFFFFWEFDIKQKNNNQKNIAYLTLETCYSLEATAFGFYSSVCFFSPLKAVDLFLGIENWPNNMLRISLCCNLDRKFWWEYINWPGLVRSHIDLCADEFSIPNAMINGNFCLKEKKTRENPLRDSSRAAGTFTKKKWDYSRLTNK